MQVMDSEHLPSDLKPVTNPIDQHGLEYASVLCQSMHINALGIMVAFKSSFNMCMRQNNFKPFIGSNKQAHILISTQSIGKDYQIH